MPHRKGGENMRIIYSKPSLKNLSQGERISYIRQLRMMSQDEVSDKLGLTGECKRRTMTRYERGDRFYRIPVCQRSCSGMRKL